MNTEAIFREFGKEISLVLIGLLMIGGGILYMRRGTDGTEIKVIEQSEKQDNADIVVEVSGAVHNPGVYEFSGGARVDDALKQAGGISENADADWIEKTINKASVLTDGQKIYIPREGESADIAGSGTEGGVVNINTASQSELESLWGIGPVYAQSIIEHRPYSSVDELLSKGVIKQNVYDRNRDKLSVY